MRLAYTIRYDTGVFFASQELQTVNPQNTGPVGRAEPRIRKKQLQIANEYGIIQASK